MNKFYTYHLGKHYNLILKDAINSVNGHSSGYIKELDKEVHVRVSKYCPHQIQVGEKQLVGKTSAKYNTVLFNKCR